MFPLLVLFLLFVFVVAVTLRNRGGCRSLEVNVNVHIACIRVCVGGANGGRDGRENKKKAQKKTLTATRNSGLLDAVVAVLAREQGEAAARVAAGLGLRVQRVPGHDERRQVRPRPALADDAGRPRSREPEQTRQLPRRRLLDHRERRRDGVYVDLLVGGAGWFSSVSW